jgi:hypothetical protein
MRVKEKSKGTYSTIVLVCRAIEAQHQVPAFVCHLVESDRGGGKWDVNACADQVGKRKPE